MEIAVITFSDFNTNYGSMLQALSLKMYLEKLGHNVTFIKYREFNDDLDEGKNLIKKLIEFTKKTIVGVYSIIKKKDIKKTKFNFEKFKKQFFSYTPLYTSNEELKDNLEGFDCYICGSDQIWNINCLGGLRTPYFLDFVDNSKRRIAYAASMGEYKVTDELKEEFSRLLNNLDFISVREEDSVDQLQNLTIKKVVSVVDPVFLTSADEWSKHLSDPIIEGDYGVCYFVRRSKLGRQIVKILAKKYKIPIYNLSDNLIYLLGTSSKYISCGPLDFVNIIKNAKFAVGTSFHLAAFSIIFNTPLISIGMETNKQRITSLLKLVNIENSFIYDKTDLSILDRFINNKLNKSNLNNYIDESKKFLSDSLLGD